jgi:hypothetical protein
LDEDTARERELTMDVCDVLDGFVERHGQGNYRQLHAALIELAARAIAGATTAILMTGKPDEGYLNSFGLPNTNSDCAICKASHAAQARAHNIVLGDEPEFATHDAGGTKENDDGTHAPTARQDFSTPHSSANPKSPWSPWR